ncbi:RNA (Guanine 9) methyltransferase [Paragonimus heterotremus]|uniref:tRNA (guanine(9)-N(1))-methyltransferase n=1 Tax=Paragonimus heterotremus TaxID=100268 RepID=A0A8J4WJA0_9TREM|nr:RNA (Guanine 9) methyltransferase [Paragonimus heterotremus]
MAQGNAPQIDVNQSGGLSEPVSKRKAKRLQNYLSRKKVRRELRKSYKSRRKARQALLLQESSLTEPDSFSTKKVDSKPLSRKALSHVPCMAESPCTTKVVIDCSYDHLMSFKDICKLANQVANCYAFNRRLTIPVQLYVTGLKRPSPPTITGSMPEPSTTRLLDRLRLASCENWDIHLCDEDFSELFDQSSVVYLCAESKHILPDVFTASKADTVSSADVFVIGGLVDHNHHPGYCYQQVTNRGYRTARLPIKESGILVHGRLVLSTLQVFTALSPVIAGTKTWVESLNDTIPPRKRVKPL